LPGNRLLLIDVTKQLVEHVTLVLIEEEKGTDLFNDILTNRKINLSHFSIVGRSLCRTMLLCHTCYAALAEQKPYPSIWAMSAP
jgi:hypothetical protein